MYEHMDRPTFNTSCSVISKPFLTFLLTAILLWLTSLIMIFVGFLFPEDYAFYWNNNRSFLSGYIIFSFVAIGAFLYYTVKKEPFYSNILIDENGVTYFDKYHYRPTRYFHWSDLVHNPEQYHADIKLESTVFGGFSLKFWTVDGNGNYHKWKENFGGYGYLPFVFKNKRKLRTTFLLGVLNFRKDLELEPILLEVWEKQYMNVA